MIKNNTYTAVVTSQEELEEFWKDPITPYWSFHYNERSIEDCPEVSGGHQATYNTIEILEESTFTRNSPTGEVTETIPVGEYGVKP